MKIFLKHIMRNIRENSGKTVFILLSLIITGLILSFFIGMYFSFESFYNLVEESYLTGYDYTVSSKTDDKIDKERIDEVCSDFEFFGVGSSNQGYLLNNSGEYVSVPMMPADISQALKMGMFDTDEESLILGENEIIISQVLAKKYNLLPREKIEYYLEDGTGKDLIIKYILKDSSLFGEGDVFLTSEENFTKLTTEEVNYDCALLKYVGDKEMSVLTDELNDIEIEYDLDFEQNEITEVPDEFNIFIEVGTIVFVFVALVVFFVLNSLVQIIIKERISVIATFRSIGASVSKMKSLLLMEMNAYGIIAGIISSLLGSTLGKNLIIFALKEISVDEMIGKDVGFENIDANQLFIIIFTTIIITLIQLGLSIIEIWKYNKLTIKECMFDKTDNKYKYSDKKTLLGIFFFIIVLISLVLLKRLNYLFVILAIISLFVAGVLLLPVITKNVSKVLDKMKNPLVNMAKDTIVNNKLQINTNIIVFVMMSIAILVISINNQAIMNNNDKLNLVKSEIYAISDCESLDTINSLRAIDNVERISMLGIDDFQYYYNEVEFANNKVNSMIFLYSDNYKTLLEDSNIIELDANVADNLSENEIILSKYLADKYNIKIGDTVVLKGIKKEENFDVEVPLNFIVKGFADTNQIEHNSIILSESMTKEIVTYFSSEHYFVRLNDEIHSTGVKEGIDKILTSEYAEIYTKNEYIESVHEENENLYSKMKMIVLVILCILIISVLNSQIVNFLGRKKQLAILYSTSMTRKQLSKMVLLEILFSYLVSAVVAILFSIILVKFLSRGLEVLGTYMPLNIGIIHILFLLFMIMLVVFSIYCIMKRKIKKMNIVEVLKHE